jgi:hypothetical protein
VESKVTIDGVEYPIVTLDSSAPTPVYSCKVTKQLFDATDPIGNAMAAVLEIIYTPTSAPARRAQVHLYRRLVGNDGTRSEWLPDGVYWIGERKQREHGQLRLVCYDALRKAEQPYMDEIDLGNWPRKASVVVSECAAKMGVALDARTTINDTYAVEYPNNFDTATVRDMLCQIAAIHAGNWTMTAEGKLRLVPFGNAPAATNYLVDHAGRAITFGGVRILV